MKILLLNPPSFNEVIGNNPAIIESERGYNPPLGLLYIAAYLQKHSRHEVHVLDAQVEELDYSQIRDRIAGLSPELVGLTVMTFTLIDVVKSVRIIKSIAPEIKIVLGGPHVFLYPEETIEMDGVDFLLPGEGEPVMKKLADVLDSGGDLSSAPSLVYKNSGGKIIKNPPMPLIENLDTLPHPARNLVPYHKYSSLLFSRTPVTTMFTSRGCPYRCSFCQRPHLGKKFRARSPGNVVDEIEQCLELGIRDFLIYDDTFTVIKKRVHEICDLIISRGLNIKWDCRARIDTVDYEMLKKMKRAGCAGIHYGIEAGTAKVLKNLRKQIDLSTAKKVCEMTAGLGIKTLNYFMLGSPGETLEDIKRTFHVMKWLKADYVHLTVFTPFPGTEIYLNGLREGVFKKDYWREFAKDPSKDFTPPHWPENFSLEELNELLIKGYRKFYLRPGYILGNLMRLETAGEFFRKLRAGARIVLMKKSG